MPLNFQLYSDYYDLFYKDKNYELEADFINALIKEFNPNAINLLELGSGTGKHAEILCKRNYQITGIDKSIGMVNRSNERNIKGFKAILSDICDYSINDKFDSIISLFHVISYLTTEENLLNCFKTAYKHLKPGGVFIFDTWFADAVIHQKPEERKLQLENEKISVERFAKPIWYEDERVVEVQYQINIENKATSALSQFTESHPMRYFTEAEIKKLSNQAGFNYIKAIEFMSGKTLNINTWTSCFIIQKPLS